MEDVPIKPRTKKRHTTEESQKPMHVITAGSLMANIYTRKAPHCAGRMAGYRCKKTC